MIYLDHAAATPVNSKTLNAMLPYFTDDFFNPSAPYLPAKHVREAYESAKDIIAHAIGAKGVDLVITSGSTESINLAFTALRTLSNKNPKKSLNSLESSNFSGRSQSLNPSQSSQSSSRPKLLTLATEHAAVLVAAKSYPHEPIKVNKYGLIDLADFRKKLTDDVALVSIALVNNELGTIQPFSEISEIIRAARQSRLQRGITLPLYLHSDASQALTLIDLNVARLGVDLLTIGAAKCGGPKAVGALYISHGIKLEPVVAGGGQERGLRSGTENVPGVIGFAAAITEAKSHLSSNRKMYQKMAEILRQAFKNLPNSPQAIDSSQNEPQKPQNSSEIASKSPHNPSIIYSTPTKNPSETQSDTFIVSQIPENVKHNRNNFAKTDQNSIISQIPEPIFLGNQKHQLASFVPVCFPGLDAERLIYRLEARGVYVSTGAACAANKGSKSHVLAAIGLTDEEIAGSLRISLGSTNTEDQIRTAAQIICEEVLHEYSRLIQKQTSISNLSQPTKNRLAEPSSKSPNLGSSSLRGTGNDFRARLKRAKAERAEGDTRTFCRSPREENASISSRSTETAATKKDTRIFFRGDAQNSERSEVYGLSTGSRTKNISSFEGKG